MVAVVARDIVDNPRLIGKPILKVIKCEGECVMYRVYGREVDAVACFLETDELDDVKGRFADFLGEFIKCEDIGVCKVGFDTVFIG